jgi:hypothetical protein
MFARPERLPKLGAAHWGLSVLALAATIAVFRHWPTEESLADLLDLIPPARAFVATCLAFLATTVLAEALVGRATRSGRSPSGTVCVALAGGHGVVLAISAWALWRGPQSRALLAGLEIALPAALIISGLGLLLALGTLAFSRRLAPTGLQEGRGLLRLTAIVQCLACLAMAGRLWQLESFVVPHPPRHVAAARFVHISSADVSSADVPQSRADNTSPWS